MRTIHKAFLFSLSFTFLLAAAEPPPEVDAALRERVQSFYQLQVDHKFRQAEEFVAADTKDYYYDSQKSELPFFNIVRIEYAPDFQRAVVTIKSKRTMMIPGADPLQVDTTFPSDWKIDAGKWCWYVDQSKPIKTPFGMMIPSKIPEKSKSIPEDITKLTGKVSTATLMDAVHPDPARIHLDPEHPAPQTVTLTNTLPGPVTITQATQSAALKVDIEMAHLGAKQSTRVTITPVAGASDRPSQLLLAVAPAGQTIRIDLDYSANP